MNIDEKSTAKIIGTNIERFLSENDISRAELAKRMNVSVASVGYWCLGRKIPRMDKIDRMCQIFHCTRTELVEICHPVALSPAAASSIYPLTSHEETIIRDYRRLTDDGRQMVDAVLSTALWQAESGTAADDIDAEVEDYRRQLLLEKKAEGESSASSIESA